MDSIVLKGGQYLKGSILFPNDSWEMARRLCRNSWGDLSHPLLWSVSEGRWVAPTLSPSPTPSSEHSPHCLSDRSQPALHTLSDQCSSNFHMYTNKRQILLKCRRWWTGLGWSLKLCIFNKLTNKVDAAGGLRTTLWEVRF